MEPNIHDIFEEYKEMMAGEAELKFNEEASSYLLQMICLQKHIRQRSSDLKYNGQEHFVYEHGIEYRPMERPWDVEKGVNKECFRNATILALRDPSLTYVEGFALSVVLPTLHAWCVTKDGDE